MNIVGITTQQEVWAASRDFRFRINQMLIIEDEYQGALRGEVVETNSFNRFIPLDMTGSAMVDKDVLTSLERLGYDIGEDTIHLAKIRLLVEAQYPVQTGARVRVPFFDEVKDLMIHARPGEGLVMGIIKSTETMCQGMDDDLKGIAHIYEDGEVKKNGGVPFIFDIKAMQQYPHIGIFGGSGSGKSFGMRVLLEEIMKLNIPAVVLDPHYEMDFSTRAANIDPSYGADFSDRFECMQIGEGIGVNFSDLSTNDLKNLLSASGQLTEAMENGIEVLHKRNDTYHSFSQRLDLLAQGLEEGENAIRAKLNEAQQQYDREMYKKCLDILAEHRNSVPLPSVKGLIWRLRRLHSDGLFNHNIQPLVDNIRLGKLTVIQGPSRLLNVFATYILNNLYRRRRDYRDALYKNIPCEFFPPFVVAADEAHTFAPKGWDKPSKSILQEISQEGRKYGVFLILATQRPTLLDETITAQLNTKLVFRTVRSSDIATIKEETDLAPEEARRLPYLRSGDAFISSAIMGRTMAIRIRLAKTASPHTVNPFDELKERRDKDQSQLLCYIKEELPVFEHKLTALALNIEKNSGGKTVIDVRKLKELLDRLCDQGKLKVEQSPFGNIYKEA
ncbi:MAG TPA: ATP-binding protein [Clostridiales bacterium]|nr:ATP-binding protein [Clostridiales bacterium]